MAVARISRRILNHRFLLMPMAQYNKVAQTIVTDMIFARKGMALCSRKLRM